ncbi:MAG: LLM class flavin-dependent oxidoreductase, partial [Actinobacteria bacterium]|nr:LLM class flavin-dependent oxidoreductase [Actinomycetota bacterium]
AAVTERIELVTNVLVAPLRSTGMLAKQAASLDRACGGRLTLGVGVGTREDDFAACGASARNRGRLIDAQLAELRRLWTARPGGGTGPQIGPAPARRGGPRMLLGGQARHAAPRAARYGDGWTMMAGHPDDFAAGAAQVRDAWQREGRAGRPATMALFYYALGGQAHRLAEQAVGGYYSWLGPEIAGQITAATATDEDTVRGYLAAFCAAGADEVIALPCSANRDQLERLADITVSAAASTASGVQERP